MNPKGHLHPATQITREIISIFNELGFSIATGPEMEHEYYNFDALNVSKDHPSRDMQDTFWIKGGERTLLATQTSAIQIRYMEKNKPPFRIIAPGKVYRNEATDATHEVQFTQLEGLMIDKNITLAELKGVLEHMMKKLFGENVAIRFRPSYFPFVEPAVEVDMKWKDKWLEMGGAGMVHPNVLRSVNLDPKEWNGFAFGFGIDRMIMLKYGVDDIRHLYTGDLRFINQF